MSAVMPNITPLPGDHPIVLRNTALSYAIAFYVRDPNNDSPKVVVDTAEMFLSFLNGAPAEEQEKEFVPPKPKKVAAPVKQTSKSETKPAEPKLEAPSYTKEEVGALVEKLLKANLRDGAVAILERYKVTSISGLMKTDKVNAAYSDLEALLISE